MSADWYRPCPRCGQPKGKANVMCNACRFSPDVVFWPKVDRSAGPEACWPWLGRLDERGYGICRYAGARRAYSVAYHLLIGPVPAGLELDHLCRNSACVNPRHLEPVPHSVNAARGGNARRRTSKFRCSMVGCGRTHWSGSQLGKAHAA